MLNIRLCKFITDFLKTDEAKRDDFFFNTNLSTIPLFFFFFQIIQQSMVALSFYLPNKLSLDPTYTLNKISKATVLKFKYFGSDISYQEHFFSHVYVSEFIYHYGNYFVLNGDLRKFILHNWFINKLLIVEKVNIKFLKINVKWTNCRLKLKSMTIEIHSNTHNWFFNFTSPILLFTI